MCRLISLVWLRVFVWSVAATLLLGVSPRAGAELIPIGVVETSTGLNWTFSWQQNGAEDLLLTTDSEDWRVILSVENDSMDPTRWVVTADVAYRPLRPEGFRLVASSGRVSGSFAANSFGDVLDAQGATVFGLFDPNPTQGGCFPDGCGVPPMSDGGLLSLRVDEREGPLPSITSTIHIGADLSAVVPEPSSGLIALAAIACLLLLRLRRVGMRRMTWCARRISYCAVITTLLALFVAAPASAESISAIEGSDIMGEAWPIQRGGPNVSQVYGWEFTTNSEVTVTDLGWLDHLQDGLLDDHEIGIWNSQQELLVSATIPLGTESRLDGLFRYVPITPTTLPAGETFVIGGVVPKFNIIVFPNQPLLTQWDTLVGQPIPTETAADIVLQSGRSATSPVENALVYPDESYDLSTFGWEYSIYLGPSFQFVPEPSSLSLAMLSLAAFILSIRHRRSSRRSNN